MDEIFEKNRPVIAAGILYTITAMVVVISAWAVDLHQFDMELTIFEHEGKQCPECGGYRWFGSGGHSLYSKAYIGKEGNFIKRLNVLMGDHYQKFDSILNPVFFHHFSVIKEFFAIAIV